MKKRLYAILPVLLLALLFSFGKPVKAAEGLILDTTSCTFDDKSESYVFIGTSYDSEENIDDAVSSDTSVVEVADVDSYLVELNPVGVGTATITVTGDEGGTATITVTVKDSYYKLVLNKTSCTLDNYSNSEAWVSLSDDSVDSIAKAVSSNTKVVKITYCESDEINFEPVGAGTATITITGSHGSTATLKVTVTDNYLKARFLSALSVYAEDGAKKITVYGESGTSGTLRIHKKTYKFSIGSSESKVIKLKKACQFGDKYVIKAQKGSYSKTISGKIKRTVIIAWAKASKKTLTISMVGHRKGDKVSITYNGKTYTKKIKSQNMEIYKFNLKKKIKKNAKIKIVVKNKKKKKVHKETFKLKKYYYDSGLC